MDSEEKKLRIFEAVMASNLDACEKHPFTKWGIKQISEDNPKPVMVSIVTEMDSVALGGLISRIAADYKDKAMQAPEHLKKAMVEGDFSEMAKAFLAGSPIELAQKIVDADRELKHVLDMQDSDVQFIEQIEARKKRAEELRNELASLGVVPQ